jgi:outer membrane protein assembly factor BamB/ribosomal protein L7/L12
MVDQKPVTLNCPSCGAPLEFDGRSSIVRCRFCKNNTLIPGLPAANEATPRASLDEVRLLAQNGNLVDAIRRYRELYDAGMKEARDAVQALADGKVVEIHRVYSGPLDAEETSRVMEEVKAMLQEGNKIEALTHYREVNDVSLTQARDVIDQIEAALTGVPVPSRPAILGQPSVRVKRGRQSTAIIVTLAILVLTGGIVVFALTGMGNLFGPRLFASGPAALIASEAGIPADVVAMFYNPDADTRLIGLVDGSTGKLRWHASPLGGEGYADGITAGGNLVYVANGPALLAYSTTDGSLAWQSQMPDRLNYGDSVILVVDDRVITLNADQSLQAYEAGTGNLLWSRRLAGYDRTLRLMEGSLVVLDYKDDTYTYNMIFLDPADGREQRIFDPSCQADQFSAATLDPDSGLLYSQAENALYLVYDSSYGCIQRLDFTSRQVTWQTNVEESYSFSPYGFNGLMTESEIIFSNGNQLLKANKFTGEVSILLENEDYEFLPLGMAGDTLVIRARRTRGTERFEMWGLNPSTGTTVWQIDLQGAAPIDPPDEMAGLVDDTDPGFTWRVAPAGLILIKFQANPNQMVLDTINPLNGLLVNEQVVQLKLVSDEDYSIPKVIGWQDQVVYLNLDSNILALDISTGKVVFIY